MVVFSAVVLPATAVRGQPVEQVTINYIDADHFFIRDLGSKYGSKVDGRDVASGREHLVNGSRIQLCPRTILKFHVSAQPEADENTQTKRYDPGGDEKTQVADPD